MTRETVHRVIFHSSTSMKEIADKSIDLVVTSPPYPMIEMWDPMFSMQDQDIQTDLEGARGNDAFERMHRILDSVWDESFRILKDGGTACINIGDATRTLDGIFTLYSSHSRILKHCIEAGFTVLPGIIWRKQVNAPNKFLGSGMLPPGAYVTLEHEHILVLRKGDRRKFESVGEKSARRESGYFWEERNSWFSDVWESIKGTRQDLHEGTSRSRSGAFPFEIAYRLVNMFSVKGDTVLDPFLGKGTTTSASIASERNSTGFEIEEDLSREIRKTVMNSAGRINEALMKRLEDHREFIRKLSGGVKMPKYVNKFLDIPVMTSQETDIRINRISGIEETHGGFRATYGDPVK